MKNTTTLTIHIDKEILRQSMNCRKGDLQINKIGQNCAIGKAIHNLFGERSWVGNDCIYLFEDKVLFDEDGISVLEADCIIWLPEIAKEFISKFDMAFPEDRLIIPELSFDIEIPDEVINEISLEEVYKIIERTPSLSLVN